MVSLVQQICESDQLFKSDLEDIICQEKRLSQTLDATIAEQARKIAKFKDAAGALKQTPLAGRTHQGMVVDSELQSEEESGHIILARNQLVAHLQSLEERICQMLQLYQQSQGCMSQRLLEASSTLGMRKSEFVTIQNQLNTFERESQMMSADLYSSADAPKAELQRRDQLFEAAQCFIQQREKAVIESKESLVGRAKKLEQLVQSLKTQPQASNVVCADACQKPSIAEIQIPKENHKICQLQQILGEPIPIRRAKSCKQISQEQEVDLLNERQAHESREGAAKLEKKKTSFTALSQYGQVARG